MTGSDFSQVVLWDETFTGRSKLFKSLKILLETIWYRSRLSDVENVTRSQDFQQVHGCVVMHADNREII